MTPSQPSNLSLAHRRRRRLLLGSVAAVSFVLIALLVALLVRNLTPRARPVLRLTPAAAAVDEQTTLLLSGSGWRRGEEVAICVASTGDSVCDAKSAFMRIEADRQGAIEVEVLAGPLLGQGLTTFIASGIDSGQVANRSFRVLKSADEGPVAVLARPAASDTPVATASVAVTATVDSQVVTPVDGSRETLTPFADWRGEYFANPDLAGEPALVRNDGALEFDWGEASPAPGLLPTDGFSVRWTRTLSFAEGSYRFSITANDGARVLVDNQVVIEAWNASSDQAISADTQLSQGNHELMVLFYDSTGPARVVVGWSPIQLATPAGVAVVPSLSPIPTQPVSTPTPTVPPGSTATWTPTVPPGSTATWTPTVPPGSTATWTPTVPPGSTPTWTPTVPPGSTATWTPTVPPGSTATWTPTVPPGSTATPTPTVTPTVPPGSTATPTPTLTPAGYRDVGLSTIDGPVGTSVTVSISGSLWTPGALVFVTLLPPNATIPPSAGQSVPTEGSAVTSGNGNAVTTQFVVPNNSLLLGFLQPIRVVVHTGNWSEWSEADTGFTIE